MQTSQVLLGLAPVHVDAIYYMLFRPLQNNNDQKY